MYVCVCVCVCLCVCTMHMQIVHNVQGTIKAVYHIRYGMPARKCEILNTLQDWLQQRAVWKEDEYTSWIQPEERVLHVYSPMWSGDYGTLQAMKDACCKRADCVCVSSQ